MGGGAPRTLPKEEIIMTTAAMTIQEFHALLKSEKEDSSLLKFLRQLTRLEKPEQVRRLIVRPTGLGWN